jgi:branched-chain amino acid transport system ATP-binding protein
MQALSIIENEHRALAAVINGMLHVVRQIRSHKGKPNFELLGAMIYYIDAFPEKFHHPKEDAYLFKKLRARFPGASPLLDRLEAEHETGAKKIRALAQALARYQHVGESQFEAFESLVNEYAEFHWNHMRTEEQELLPLANAHLTQEDWKEIDAAFSGHSDPLLGGKAGEEYEALFLRIVNLAPPPIGLGGAT